MAEFVLDASVAISWCFPGDPSEDTVYSRRILNELLLRDTLVPEIWAFKIANNTLFRIASAGLPKSRSLST